MDLGREASMRHGGAKHRVGGTSPAPRDDRPRLRALDDEVVLSSLVPDRRRWRPCRLLATLARTRTAHARHLSPGRSRACRRPPLSHQSWYPCLGCADGRGRRAVESCASRMAAGTAMSELGADRSESICLRLRHCAVDAEQLERRLVEPLKSSAAAGRRGTNWLTASRLAALADRRRQGMQQCARLLPRQPTKARRDQEGDDRRLLEAVAVRSAASQSSGASSVQEATSRLRSTSVAKLRAHAAGREEAQLAAWLQHRAMQGRHVDCV